jgi:hypothetical protein
MSEAGGALVGQAGQREGARQVVQVVALAGGVVFQQRAAAQQGEGIGER